MSRAVHQPRPARVPARRWHGVGYAVHARRAAAAALEFGVGDVRAWCSALRTPLPRRQPGGNLLPAHADSYHEWQGGVLPGCTSAAESWDEVDRMM